MLRKHLFKSASILFRNPTNFNMTDKHNPLQMQTKHLKFAPWDRFKAFTMKKTDVVEKKPILQRFVDKSIARIPGSEKKKKWRFKSFDRFKTFKLKKDQLLEKPDPKVIMRRMESRLRGVEVEMSKIAREPGGLSTIIKNPFKTLKRLMVPLRLRRSVDATGAQVMKMQFDIGEYKPEEVRVTIKNRLVSIHARKNNDIGSVKRFKEFKHEFSLPHGIRDDVVTYNVNKKGTLTIEAPLPGEMK